MVIAKWVQNRGITFDRKFTLVAFLQLRALSQSELVDISKGGLVQTSGEDGTK